MVDYDRLRKIKAPVDLVLSYDTEKLLHESDVRRIELWNEIKIGESVFEQEFVPSLASEQRDDIASQFSFAELKLAAVEQKDDEQTGLSRLFNKIELSVVQDYDRFDIFDVSAKDLAERMQRKSEIYNLALEYSRQYSKLEDILDSPQIRKDIKLFLKKIYKERLSNVNEGVQIYIGKFGLNQAVKQINKSVLDIIKQSEKQRAAIVDEKRRTDDQLSIKLKTLPELEQITKSLKDSLDKLESSIVNGEPINDINTLDIVKDELSKSYSSLGNELVIHLGNIEKRKRELELSESELQKNTQDFCYQEPENNKRLIEDELKEISNIKSQLAVQASNVKNEKDILEIQRQEIIDRFRQVTQIAQGASIRYISSQDARLCEMNFLARYDSKMQSYPVRLYSAVEKKEFVVRSWKEGEHLNISDRNTPDSPWNVHDSYIVNEKKHGLLGENVKKIVIEAISLNHLDEFEQFNFDSRSATLADFLNLVKRIIDQAEGGKYLHVVGIASPTGWDEKVQNEVQSPTFAHNYISHFVSFCLVDSVTGQVFFNPKDDRISKFVEYFTPEFNREKTEKVKQYILAKLAIKEYVVLDDAITELRESRTLVNKGFYDMQREGKGKLKYIKEVGLVIQTAK